MSIYPNWLMCIGDGTNGTVVTYVGGMDMSIEEDTMSMSLEETNISCIISEDTLTMEICQ